jgi:hypothetical protein
MTLTFAKEIANSTTMVSTSASFQFDKPYIQKASFVANKKNDRLVVST